ncbi:hypothetical protein HYW83_06375 [Candidatus Peregrinibacteria bacterium]|nr:hypothetical protein [Candidatus Peregrinibacteria bacterium]
MKQIKKIYLGLGVGLFFATVFVAQAQSLTPDKLQQLQDLKKLYKEAEAKNPALSPYTKQSLEMIEKIESANKLNKNPIAAPKIPIKPSAPILKPALKSPDHEVIKENFPETKKKISLEKRAAIHKEAQQKFSVVIKENTQDTNRDGVSDEVETLLGIDPKKPQSGHFSGFEKKLYGLDTPQKAARVEKQCNIGVLSGAKLSLEGFTVLAACPKGQQFALYAMDEQGFTTALGTQTASDNYKIVFVVDKNKLSPGKYTFQLEAASPLTLNSKNGQADVVGIVGAGANEPSKPVAVEIVPSTAIPQPQAQKIENVDIAALKNIKVFKTGDGRIHVSGVADISAMVVGTFSSAIFTSALLANVETGAFEIISAQPLETGDHEVVLYATELDQRVQSKPVQLKFSIVDVNQKRGAAPQQNFPWRGWWGVALGITAAIIAGFLIFRKKKAH